MNKNKIISSFNVTNDSDSKYNHPLIFEINGNLLIYTIILDSDVDKKIYYTNKYYDSDNIKDTYTIFIQNKKI